MRLRANCSFRAAAPDAEPAQWGPSSRVSASVAGIALLLAMADVGCSSSRGQNAGAQSPERQSDAEYDIARDLFQKGDTRNAIAHVQKSVSLNEENDRAHYLLAALLLSFCTGPKGLEGTECNLA